MKNCLDVHTFEEIVCLENLLEVWCEFLVGKRKRKDVQEFELHLMKNLILLHDDLISKQYKHQGYQAFKILDPKPRSIHKASVRDRVLHRAIYRKLYPFFDRTFISDSFSCRNDKGTHRALIRFRIFGRRVSKNNTRTCWVLKCDIKKFFASIDHTILQHILEKYITDPDLFDLLKKIIHSFSTSPNKGLPLGNLTSQLLVNIYMNEFDQFVKHKLKVKYYLRYADDFVFLSHNREKLLCLVPVIDEFLKIHLRLQLHPNKLFLKTLASGVDFLGWVHFTDHRVLRTVTKNRMFKRIQEHPIPETLQSYLGLLEHGNTRKIQNCIL